MPVALITLHGYGTWLPDRPEGYYDRQRGRRPSNPQLARAYRHRMSRDAVTFAEPVQRTLVEAVIELAEFQRLDFVAAASNSTHAHVLIAWRDDREGVAVRRGIKRAVSIKLNAHHGKRQWFSRGGTITLVRGEPHLEHLRSVYLPRHDGVKYDRTRGIYA